MNTQKGVNDRLQHLETVELENLFNTFRVNMLAITIYVQFLEFQKSESLLKKDISFVNKTIDKEYGRY